MYKSTYLSLTIRNIKIEAKFFSNLITRSPNNKLININEFETLSNEFYTLNKRVK